MIQLPGWLKKTQIYKASFLALRVNIMQHWAVFFLFFFCQLIAQDFNHIDSHQNKAFIHSSINSFIKAFAQQKATAGCSWPWKWGPDGRCLWRAGRPPRWRSHRPASLSWANSGVCCSPAAAPGSPHWCTGPRGRGNVTSKNQMQAPLENEYWTLLTL